MNNSINLSKNFKSNNKRDIFIDGNENEFFIKDIKKKSKKNNEKKIREEIKLFVNKDKKRSIEFKESIVKDNDKYIKKERKGSKWLYEEIMKKMIIIKISGAVHVYRNNLGYYELISDNNLEKFIRGEAPKEFSQYINCNIVRETIMWIKSDKSLEICKENYEEYEPEIDSIRYINFKNGIYDIYNDSFFDHSPNYIFTSYINCDYNIDDNLENKVFAKYIMDCCDEDKKSLLQIQELLGVAISNYRGFKKAFFLLGPPNSGKSTFLDLLINLIGIQFCSNVNLHDLNERFRVAGLCGKKLNAVGEMSEINLKRLDIFKSITGNDFIQAEFKGKDPFEFKNKALLIFAGNNLPKLNVEDPTGAFYQRMNLIVFQKRKKAEEINHNLLNDLLKEKQFIIKFALKGLKRLIKRNFRFSESDLAIQVKDNHYKKTNSFNQFLNEMCIFKVNSRISNRVFEEQYYKYCEKKCIDIIPKSEINSILRKLNNIRRKKMRIEGEVVNGIEGIEVLKDFI